MCDDCTDRAYEELAEVAEERDEWKMRWLSVSNELQALREQNQALRDTLDAVRVSAYWWVNTLGRPHADGALLGREILHILGDQ